MSHETELTRPMISLVVGVVALSGIMVALAVGRETAAIDPVLAKRGVAIGIGLIMMLTANQLPKLLPPARSRARCASTKMSPERFAGWTFVLAGAAYVAVLVVAPIHTAMPLAALVGLSAFAIAGVNWTVGVLAGSAANQRKEAIPRTSLEDARVESAKRLVLINLFFACFWVFATFLADSIWGDRVSQLMAVAFIVLSLTINAILLQWWRKHG